MTDEVFDLDALIAETTGEPFRFRFGGEDYELPHSLDIRAVAAFDAGRIEDALARMLGPEQWQRMLDAKAVFDDKALTGLMTAYADHAGVSLGKSSGPGGRSKRTPPKSKRTSPATTARR